MDTRKLLQDIWEIRTDFLDEIIRKDSKYNDVVHF